MRRQTQKYRGMTSEEMRNAQCFEYETAKAPTCREQRGCAEVLIAWVSKITYVKMTLCIRKGSPDVFLRNHILGFLAQQSPGELH